MKNLLQKFIILCLLSLSWHTANAFDCKVNGIYYNLSGRNATVTYNPASKYYDSVIIPSTIVYSNKTYSVTTIGESAFSGCSGLTSITIPSTVTSIGRSAFHACGGLYSITIPNSVTSIGSSAFFGCSGLTTVAIPNSVTIIESGAFYKCSGLTAITIPSSVTSIGRDAFAGCNNLTVVTMNSNAVQNGTNVWTNRYSNIFGTQVEEYVLGTEITSIGNLAFLDCSSLTTLTIPNSVTSIGNSAFLDCSSLTTLTIPNSVTSIGKDAFSGTAWYDNQPNGVVYAGNVVYTYKGTMPNSTTITLIDGTVGIANHAFEGCSGLTSITFPYSLTNIGDYAFKQCSGLTTVSIPDNVINIGEAAFKDCYNLTSVNIPYGVTSIFRETFYGCHNLVNLTIPSSVTTIGHLAFLSCVRLTSVIIPDNMTDIAADAFDDCRATKYVKSGTVGLLCLWNAGYSPYDLDTSERLLRPTIKILKQTPTSVSMTINLVNHENYQTSLTPNGISVDGDVLLLSGLDPNNQFTIEYAIEGWDENGSTYTYRTSKEVSIGELTLTTSQPKVISVGNVIVAAASNLDDEETNVGFEWRRTDWTDDFASNTGRAYLYEGTMEGYIRNLYTGAFWKYRPYYQSSSGTYYYGDWVGIDPTNTSYFEPTVHTYARINIEGNTALVRGYALRGTDNVTVQGFMYWRQVNEAKERGDAQHRAPAIPKDAMTVEASGQVMEAQLTGLDYETTYCYVAFVKTSEGETFYGETQTFTTDVDVTSIESITVDSSTTEPATVVARYNMNGQRITTPQRGVNILRMSDGTVKKVLVK